MRVYVLGNLDGTRKALVAAHNQREAASLMGASFGGFKAYGGHETADEESVRVALAEPGVVFYKPIFDWSYRGGWTKDRQVGGRNRWEDAGVPLG